MKEKIKLEFYFWVITFAWFLGGLVLTWFFIYILNNFVSDKTINILIALGYVTASFTAYLYFAIGMLVSKRIYNKVYNFVYKDGVELGECSHSAINSINKEIDYAIRGLEPYKTKYGL